MIHSSHWEQFREFWEALRGEFDTPRLTRMVRFALYKRLDEIARPVDFQQVVFGLIQDTVLGGYTMELLNAALQSQPGNERLLAFAQQFRLSAVTAEQGRIVRGNQKFIQVSQ